VATVAVSKYFNPLFGPLAGLRGLPEDGGLFSRTAAGRRVGILAGLLWTDLSSWDRYETDVLSHPLLALPPDARALVQRAVGLTHEFLQLCLEAAIGRDTRSSGSPAR